VAILNKPLYYRRYRIGSIMQTDDYLNKNRSLCIGIQRINDIIEQYAVSSYKICQIEIALLVKAIISNWEKMNTRDQYSNDSRKIIKKIKPFAKKYRYGNEFRVWLFFCSLNMYKLERCLMKYIRERLVKKIRKNHTRNSN